MWDKVPMGFWVHPIIIIISIIIIIVITKYGMLRTTSMRGHHNQQHCSNCPHHFYQIIITCQPLSPLRHVHHLLLGVEDGDPEAAAVVPRQPRHLRACQARQDQRRDQGAEGGEVLSHLCQDNLFHLLSRCTRAATIGTTSIW